MRAEGRRSRRPVISGAASENELSRDRKGVASASFGFEVQFKGTEYESSYHSDS
jgi:hypothetical protein